MKKRAVILPFKNVTGRLQVTSSSFLLQRHQLSGLFVTKNIGREGEKENILHLYPPTLWYSRFSCELSCCSPHPYAYPPFLLRHLHKANWLGRGIYNRSTLQPKSLDILWLTSAEQNQTLVWERNFISGPARPEMKF